MYKLFWLKKIKNFERLLKDLCFNSEEKKYQKREKNHQIRPKNEISDVLKKCLKKINFKN